MYRIGQFLILLILTSHIKAATITGHVLDAKTKETLVGANVYIKTNTQLHDISGFDGSFKIRNVPPGQYILVVSYISYATQEKKITVNSNSDNFSFEFKMEPATVSLNQVEVVSNYDRESGNYARNKEKVSDNVLNVLSAKTIQLLPDNTTASVLQRMSGVSVERTSSGEARYAIIRGMNKRYNYTLVNGVKIPSPNDKYRYVPMDMFPADLLERVEVIKSLTPAMEGDAIGGAINLVMKDAPNVLTFNAHAGTGFSELLTRREYSNFDKNVVSDKSPVDIHGATYQATPYDFTYKNFDYQTRKLPFNENVGLSFGNRFLKNKQLGIIVAGSYQNEYKGSDRIWFKPSNQPAPGNVPAFEDFYSRQYNTQSTRYGLHSKIDYEFNPNNKISLYNLFLKMDDIEYRESIDTSLSIGRNGVGTGNTYLLYRSEIQHQSIYNSTLQGEHTILGEFQS